MRLLSGKNIFLDFFPNHHNYFKQKYSCNRSINKQQHTMSKQHFIPKENGSLANEVKTLIIPIAKQSATQQHSPRKVCRAISLLA